RVNQPPSADYEFLLGEMRVGPDGKGEGKLVPRARIRYNKGSKSIEIENYASEPGRLRQGREISTKANRGKPEPRHGDAPVRADAARGLRDRPGDVAARG